MLRARSHRYPDPEAFIDTTYYHPEEEYLDVGYQYLKVFRPSSYPELSKIKKLFIDHNRLTTLPDPSLLSCLNELTCSANRLSSVPFYPRLTFLSMAGNNIKDLSSYHQSHLKYLDASFNKHFRFDIHLPCCEQLYLTDCKLTKLDLNLTPKLQLLDVSNNQITHLVGGIGLIELDIQNNKISEIDYYPKLKRLVADNNKLTKLPTYPQLVSVSISSNHLVAIPSQPLLRKLIANNNDITEIGDMPSLELCDLSHNSLKEIKLLSGTLKYLSLHFNPIKDLELSDSILRYIKELRINFDTYQSIYKKYYQYFDSIHIQTSGEKLNQLFEKFDNSFDEKMRKYITKHLSMIKYPEREEAFCHITFAIYSRYFPINNRSLREIIETNEFQKLWNNISLLYYKTVIITLYFNGHF